MAGPGVALRLHEFKEREGNRQAHEMTDSILGVKRQGRDVVGLYPGQQARVHIMHSENSRMNLTSLEQNWCTSPDQKENVYLKCFDLLTLQNLEVLRQDGKASSPKPTAYEEEFGLMSEHLSPDDTKFTLNSHPEL
ncbi:uncharacterized protein C1orf100 [Denticeps clupeoides]|uniref:uncharacterized protein C1orf100 n=1 Tax=Denticeps clupeoides TaxID=299321 RepID=UPI0010A3267D|nr:uncharacterized protein C1orf100 homolog [Denticeps clupeoides]